MGGGSKREMNFARSMKKKIRYKGVGLGAGNEIGLLEA